MLIFHKIKPDLIESTCLALGVFDGIHLGHKKVILDAVKKSEFVDGLVTIVTFSRHPQSITTRTPTKLITSLEQKLEIFEDLGVQVAVILEFTEELSRLSAGEYIKSVLIDSLNPRTITIGYDHRFGFQKR